MYTYVCVLSVKTVCNCDKKNLKFKHKMFCWNKNLPKNAKKI